MHTIAQPVPGASDPSRLQSYDKLLHAAQACIKSCVRSVRLPPLCTQTYSFLKSLRPRLARRPGGPGKLVLCSCGTLSPAWLSAFPKAVSLLFPGCVLPSLHNQLVWILNPCSCLCCAFIGAGASPAACTPLLCGAGGAAHGSSWLGVPAGCPGDAPCVAVSCLAACAFGWHNYVFHSPTPESSPPGVAANHSICA